MNAIDPYPRPATCLCGREICLIGDLEATILGKRQIWNIVCTCGQQGGSSADRDGAILRWNYWIDFCRKEAGVG